ncbi:hypothetical protein KCP70_22000 [Salmonella enterica subsp. enterica]|nr:hypothetical protein KCP70_22000 [Salmonella enterica subsp. enterica]
MVTWPRHEPTVCDYFVANPTASRQPKEAQSVGFARILIRKHSAPLWKQPALPPEKILSYR